VSEFLGEALKFGMQNPNSNNLTLAQKGPMQSINYDQILYHINYVKNWAFLLSEWINLQ
jgi:hypothetical protein